MRKPVANSTDSIQAITVNDSTIKMPKLVVYGILLICVIPYLLLLAGINFDSSSTKINHQWADSAIQYQIVDAQFRALSGAFIHTLLEWTAFCVAVFVVVLALSHYKITNDISTPVIGVALFMAGTMDAFHTLAAARLIEAVADNRDLIPFTWAICRTFNALIMIAGVSVLLLRTNKSPKQDFKFVITISLVFGVIAYLIITIAANTASLPKTTYPDLFITRPYDAIPLGLFLIAGLIIYPRLYKRRPSLFTHALVLSAIPEVVSQLHMTFGSTVLFDSHFNIGHFLKIIAYSIPLLGLILEYIRTHNTLHSEIKDRKEVVNALMASEVKQRTILETVADSIITIDDKGIIVTFNPAAEKIFGYGLSEVVGQNVSILLPEKEQVVHKSILAKSTLQAPRSIDRDHQLFGRKKDGTHFPLAVNLAPTKLADGDGTVGVLRDITEQKKSEQVLKQFKTTLDKTMDCVFMFSPETLKFFYVNAGAIEQVGYSEQELLNMTPFDIKPDFDEKLFRETLEPFILGNKDVLNFETVHQHKDGHTVPVEIFLQYIHPEGEAPRFVAMVRDISERQRIDRLKDQFVSTVSHELRTPLTSIRGSLGLITGGAVGELPEQVKSMLKIAENNTQRLLMLINDILDMQKIETGELTFDYSELLLMPFLEQAIKDNAAYGELYGVTFTITKAMPEVQLLTDKHRLSQVMANLLSNAAKFSVDASDVEIAVSYHKNSIRISVSDYGMGIAKEFQSKLFDQFTQADSADTRKIGGTGLGLSICKATVEKLGGKISFTSSAGEGTSFYIDLPHRDKSREKVAHPQPEDNITWILVIEDEPDTAITIQQILLKDGIRSDIAQNLTQARELLQNNSNRYKAVTLDLMLANEESINFVQELHSKEHYSDLPVVIVSVKAEETQSSIKDNEVTAWIQKPINHQRLLDTIRTAAKLGLPKILHVEADIDVRNVVSVLLKGHADITNATTIGEARMHLEAGTFNLVLLDLDMPDCPGQVLLNEIDDYGTPPKVVLFTSINVEKIVKQKANAVLLKSMTSNTELLQTIIELLNDYQGYKQASAH